MGYGKKKEEMIFFAGKAVPVAYTTEMVEAMQERYWIGQTIIMPKICWNGEESAIRALRTYKIEELYRYFVVARSTYGYRECFSYLELEQAERVKGGMEAWE